MRLWEGFAEGLRELGYIEGKNIVIERRYYEGGVDALDALAVELVRLGVDVIVAGASPAPEVAKRVTSTVPIVMATHVDPLTSGLVASLAKPGGNVTGTSLAATELRGKQLQLLKETLPKLSRVAILLDPTSSTYRDDLREVEGAARSLQMPIAIVEARAPNEFADAFSAAVKARVGALLIIGGTALIYSNRRRIAELAIERRLPTMTGLRDFAEVGCLMAYGPNLLDGFRRAAWYVDRILKGAKPGDLPVEQATTFALTINLKTAKALGLSIPLSVTARADATIE
ncbi:MAG TPA: ABC transporter substrate-binding protein [Casimicrobiaceae bacterium]|nr:ABC transporter substrate-binding protein [Casimicrobiaceae bacterium]